MKLSRALWISAAWIAAALAFNAGILYFKGQQKALEFLTGYVIELSLSIDNLFVFYLIFSRFRVTPAAQARILTWGVLGAQLLRLIFILAGVALLKSFSWVIYAFGALLIFSGVKLFTERNTHEGGDHGWWTSFEKYVPAGSFIGVLLLVEAADLVFAIDSVPAVLAVTKDPLIVYSSNIFAILGLRSMYFILSGVIDKFDYLHYTLGIILIFTGIKMVLDPVWPMPTAFALGFVAAVLAVFGFLTYVKLKR